MCPMSSGIRMNYRKEINFKQGYLRIIWIFGKKVHDLDNDDGINAWGFLSLNVEIIFIREKLSNIQKEFKLKNPFYPTLFIKTVTLLNLLPSNLKQVIIGSHFKIKWVREMF
jgi:hypothetical protein